MPINQCNCSDRELVYNFTLSEAELEYVLYIARSNSFLNGYLRLKIEAND